MQGNETERVLVVGNNVLCEIRENNHAFNSLE